MIIGIMGKAQAGKTTTAKMIIKNTPGAILSFATPLKEMVIQSGICSRNEVFIDKTWFGRKILQLIGTDLIRNQIDTDFWVYKMEEQIHKADSDLIVIDDVRFKNEVDYIKAQQGVTIRVLRPGTGIESNSHASETETDGMESDHCIWNTGSMIDLEEIICDIMTLVPLEAK